MSLFKKNVVIRTRIRRVIFRRIIFKRVKINVSSDICTTCLGNCTRDTLIYCRKVNYRLYCNPKTHIAYNLNI